MIDIVQVGSSVTIEFYSTTFSGTVSGNSLSATGGSFSMFAKIAPGEDSIVGHVGSLPPPDLDPDPFRFERCECHDGNGNNGDGCDDECRVEPCYTCTPAPSICTAEPDGAACDDNAACTSGETCSAAVCSGGSPVSPCVDLGGAWSLHLFFPDFQVGFDSQFVFTQRNTHLEAGLFDGTIDPATGAFQLTNVPAPFICTAGDHLAGQAALDGLSLTGVYTAMVPTATQCPAFNATVTGTRCGGGTLDASEECDDGNRMDGDGCDTACQIEACFACSGSPSTCTPLPNGTGCDDDEECTTADVCTDGVCDGTAQPDGTSCSDGAICTQSDTCAQGLCTGTPLACGQCQMCDGTTPACVPRPDPIACDDGDACTSGDACQAGACVGSPLFCAPCTACDGAGGCVSAPRTGCLAATAPARSKLAMTDAGDPADDGLSWNWRGGPGAVPDLGDPTQGTAYALCVFDESTSPPTALITAPAPQVSCPEFGCWTSRRHGFSYRNPNGDDNGLTRIELRARPDGRVKALVRGKGPFLNPPRAPLSLPLRVQLHAIEFDTPSLQTCFEAEYDPAGVRVNDNGVFRARATGP